MYFVDPTLQSLSRVAIYFNKLDFKQNRAGDQTIDKKKLLLRLNSNIR